MSNPLTTATGQMQGCPTSALSLTGPQMQGQVPSQLVPPLTIDQRLQQLAMSADGVTTSPTLRGIPPRHTQEEKEWIKIKLTLWQALLTPSLPQPQVCMTIQMFKEPSQLLQTHVTRVTHVTA